MERIPQLDGIRGCAIVLVLAWHYIACQGVPYTSKVLGMAWSGVDLFFVLSGYLIGGVLLDNRDTTNFFRIFYLRRVGRIFPLYYMLIALYIIMAFSPLSGEPRYQWLLANPFPYWTYATFTQNYFMGMTNNFGANWLGITWSLAIEEQFYLVLPLLIFCVPRRFLPGILTVGIVAAPVLRHFTPGWGAVLYTPMRADSLLSGVGLALLTRSPQFMGRVREHRVLVHGLFVVLLVGIAMSAPRRGLFGVFEPTWLAAFYSALILMVLSFPENLLSRIFLNPILLWLGEISFGIYMSHQMVSGIVHGFFRGAAPAISSLTDAAITFSALFLTFLLAWVSFHFFEQPILRYCRKFPYRYLP